MAKTSKTMLNRSGESRHLCLVPDIRGNAFYFSPLRIMFAVCLSYMAFIMGYEFLTVFFMKEVVFQFICSPSYFE